MPVAPEMYVLNAEIGGDEDFVARRDAQYRTIVANAGYYRPSSWRDPPNLLDQFAFAKWHLNHYNAAGKQGMHSQNRYTSPLPW